MKLGNLLKKELRELLTAQAIFSMIFSCLLFVILGQFMGGVMDEAMNNSSVNIRNLDSSQFTADMLAALPEYGADPEIIEGDGMLSELGVDSLVIIPEGFGDSIVNGDEAIPVQCVSLVNGGGLSSAMGSISASSLTDAVYRYVSDYVREQRLNLTEEEQALLDEPMVYVEYTEANGKTAAIPADSLQSMLMTQSMIAPMAVFFLVMMASQMIMTAISTEKIDKTLETLLSAPVSRLSVLMAKMIAALVVALLNAASMIVGMLFYIQGMIGGVVAEETARAEETMAEGLTAAAAIAELGINLTAGDIILFGLQLFLTIAIGLSVSLILGAMATDVKSVQTLTLPVMMMTMIPFFFTIFTDVASLSLVPKAVMYLIPFTHTYTALNNIMFGRMGLFWGGLAYQLIFFIVCMYLAVRVFTTDRLFTMSFAPGKRKKQSAAGS